MHYENNIGDPIVECFLPCRLGSERVPKKNLKPFLHYQFGLLEIKLNQLLACTSLSKIVVSTNDNEIIDFCVSLNSEKIEIDVRADYLCSSATSTDDLIRYVPQLFGDNYILWTHVTSPFFTSSHYESVVASFFESESVGYDSLMTVTPNRDFLWDDLGPINYDRTVEKWPRTQTIKNTFTINSAAFLAHKKIYEKYNDRIGEKPFYFEVNASESHDIDWPEQFELAKLMLSSGMVSL